MRFAAAIIALLASAPAYAGGIGPIVMGGFHNEPVYYYSSRVVNPDGSSGGRISNPNEYPQFKDPQFVGNVGSGLELMLGGRDDYIQGVFRLFWMMDTPQSDPRAGTDLQDVDALIANWRTTPTHTGVGTVGLQWGIIRAASDRFKFGASLHVGSGFISAQRNEFLLAMVGTNASYQINRTLEVFIDIDYGLRVRKSISHGLYGTAGLRVLFD